MQEWNLEENNFREQKQNSQMMKWRTNKSEGGYLIFSK